MATTLYGQTVIDTTYSAEYLVQKMLLGNGVLAGNVTFSGEKHAISAYFDEARPVGIEKGILLTSGNAFYAIGPNKNDRSGWASAAPGDDDLEKIARGKTWDAAVLEFDFVTTSENLSFRFVFASEEYLEYVGSKYNDVFGFFVTGPQLGKINIARLPDDVTPITVNTVNNELNNQYYTDNTYHNTTDPYIWDVRNRKVIANANYLQEEIPPKFDSQFDGFTRVLEAHCTVIPNQVYHIKLAIADVGDDILDSGVFLEAGSFQSYGQKIVALDDHFKKDKELTSLASKKETIILEHKLPEPKLLKKVLVGQIEFDFDEYTLTQRAISTAVQIFNTWNEKIATKIQLVGHTDNWGSHDYNVDLSKKRSESVAKQLVDLGVPENLVAINFMGEVLPISTNNSEMGRARNRRVEVYLIYD